MHPQENYPEKKKKLNPNHELLKGLLKSIKLKIYCIFNALNKKKHI